MQSQGQEIKLTRFPDTSNTSNMQIQAQEIKFTFINRRRDPQWSILMNFHARN